MYEIEYKVEITREEREKLLKLFKEKGFKLKRITPQNDFYTEAEKSSFGGYDFKRYRNEDGKFIFTEKVWEKVGGEPVRKESENELSKDEFESIISKFPKAIKIKKDREWFAGSYKGKDISVTIDTVKFDHSFGTRYFIEGEILSGDKSKVSELKGLIIEFLKESLNKKEIINAPNMFTMAFEKK